MSAKENSAKKVNKKAVFLGALIAAIVGLSLMGGSEDKVSEPAASSTAPSVDITGDINQITIRDRDAALTSFAKQIEASDQKLMIMQRDMEARLAELQKQTQRTEHNLRNEISSLSSEIIGLRADDVDKMYSGINDLDSRSIQGLPPVPDQFPISGDGLNFDGLNFNSAPPAPINQAEANPYGPNYFILKPQPEPEPSSGGQIFSSSSGGNQLTAGEQQLFSSMNSPGNDMGSQQPAPQQPQYKSAAEAYAAQQSNAQNNNAAPIGPRMERIEIPAFSYVEVTTLHGVACPIGANSPGSQSSIPARPVVLPVRGIFRGPNGATVDVGNIHLMGLCSGRRTSSSKTGRALVRVEQMSYWDVSDTAQHSAAVGYIVDTRDNEQDVFGKIDKASGRTLALESASAAAAAFASSLSRSEYTTQNNLDSNGSTSTSQLTGDATKAAVSDGIAGLFTNIARRFEQEANAAIDTVLVEPGIKLRFITEQPIHIYTPAEAFDIDQGLHDVLI